MEQRIAQFLRQEIRHGNIASLKNVGPHRATVPWN
jgi:hypothetical protein